MVAALEGKFGAVGGIDVGVLGKYEFADAGGGSLTITQAAGNESAIADITTTNTSPVANNPTATITAAGVAAVAGTGEVAEAQQVDFAGKSLASGRSLEINISGETLSYTNDTGASLVGEDLVAKLATEFGTTEVVNGVGEYTFSQDATTTTLNITQAATNESNIGDITVDTPGSVDGTYAVKLDGVQLDLDELKADGTVTAEDVAGAIDAVTNFSASVNDDGAIVITQANAASFTLSEAADVNGDASLDAPAGGLAGIGDQTDGTEVVSTLTGQVNIASETDVSLVGTAGLEAAGLSEVGNVTTTIDNVSVATREDAWVAIESVDAALTDIDRIRGGLGAVQNRFESTIANLNNVSENLSAARSRILDADIAMETSAMTKNNILQQAGVSILAQANQAPQLALSLIG